MPRAAPILCVVALILAHCAGLRAEPEATNAPANSGLDWVKVSRDKHGFVGASSGRPFIPWGFNYDRDYRSRLLEDYWEAEWPTVVEDFREMKQLGANVVRVHLQFAKFMDAAGPAQWERTRTPGPPGQAGRGHRALPRSHGPGVLSQEGRSRLVQWPGRDRTLGSPSPLLGRDRGALRRQPGHLLL